MNWRLGFWWLASVGLVLAIAVASMLREPLRGGGSPVTQRSAPRRSIWRDVCYVLSIRTSIVLVVGCSFGYFFMAGLSTFGVALMRGQFHVGQSVATLLIVVLASVHSSGY